MKTLMLLACVPLVVSMVWMAASGTAGTSPQRPLAHMVYFSLSDKSPEATQRLVEACHQHLSGHEGMIYFSVGTRAKEFDRPVNDQEFDVALNMVFASKAAHDTYQDHPRHVQFIEENRDSWASVRVYDSYLTE